MCLTKRFLDWLEGKFEALDYEHDSDEKVVATSVTVGFIEGIVDGCVYLGFITLVAGIIGNTIGLVQKILKKS